jgi:hypothetical protein
MRHMTILLALVCVPLAGAEPSLMDNPDAQVIMVHYDKAVADAKKAYDLAVAKAATTAVKELQHVQADETKMGRLEVAMAAKKKIEELQPLTVVAAAVPGAKFSDQKERFLAGLLGEWTTKVGGPWVISRDASGNPVLFEKTGGNTSTGSYFVGTSSLVFMWKLSSCIVVKNVGGKWTATNYHYAPDKQVEPTGGAYWSDQVMTRN